MAIYEDDGQTVDIREQFVYHNAGLDGRGGSSYIDDVVLRDRDTTGNGTLDERVYYCQNWRHDVVTLLDDAGAVVEHIRYSAYGIPFLLPGGDTNSDAKCDVDDQSNVLGWWGTTTQAHVLGDANLDGTINIDDFYVVLGNWGTYGWHMLSMDYVGNRKGYAGYEEDAPLEDAYILYHVRNRVLNSDLGRWMTRDPAGYVEGAKANLYEYGVSNPTATVDPMGLVTVQACNNLVTWCLNNDPVVIDLHNDLTMSGCALPTIRCVNEPKAGWRGMYTCVFPHYTVTLNAPRIGLSTGVCRVLSHELQHALDHCDHPFFCSLFGYCRILQCSEIRAYNRSGSCCPNGFYRTPGETYKECVIRKAKDSMPLACDSDFSKSKIRKCFKIEDMPRCRDLPTRIPRPATIRNCD